MIYTKNFTPSNNAPGRRAANPNLFVVNTILIESEGEALEPSYQLQFNPKFEQSRSFAVEDQTGNLPELKYATGEVLLGKAWVKGTWKNVFAENSESLAWRDGATNFLNSEWTRLEGNAPQTYGSLTLHKNLNEAATSFADNKGRALYNGLLTKHQNSEKAFKLPPRAAITVMRLSDSADNGAVLALGGFPRAVGGTEWRQNSAGDWLPPINLVEKMPPDLRSRYRGDRNFDVGAVMGSSIKPMWAAAVLATHPSIELHRRFRVSGSNSGDTDDSVFGIPVAGKSWNVPGDGAAVDFNKFLVKSNNRYQVLLGFLGVAQSSGNAITIEPNAFRERTLEQMDDRDYKNYPQFEDNVRFGRNNSNGLTNLQATNLATNLSRMFGTNTIADKEQSAENFKFKTYLNSFWTKNEEDDLSTNKVEKLPNWILPARANLQLQKITTPREYVSLLLGGGENKWSNVHVAAAFGSCITGKPVVPHIVKNDVLPKSIERNEDFVDFARILRPGLKGVADSNGTAYNGLAPARQFLTTLRANNFLVLAKTGTLGDENVESTSRIILAVVRLEGDTVKTGLVFSLYAERAGKGASTAWLGEFLNQNQNEIRALLGLGSVAQPASGRLPNAPNARRSNRANR